MALRYGLWSLAGLAVIGQAIFPLVSGDRRHQLTVVTTYLFFAASVGHALSFRGIRFAAALVAVAAGGGLLIEVVGVRVGVPFSRYTYSDTLGWKVLDVPVVVPLAWAMMAYPAFTVGRRVAGHPAIVVIAGAWALTSWDLFLDPLMVREGHWAWPPAKLALAGVPAANFLGWFVTSLAMMAALNRVADRHSGDSVDDRLPFTLYMWVFVSLLFVHTIVWPQRVVAWTGGAGMGAVVAMLVYASRGRARVTMA